MVRIYTQDKAEERCRYWQEKLRIQDWEIKIKITRHHDMESKEVLGEVEVLSAKQIAVIRLLDPVDFQPDLGFVDEQDHEITLIHELLHVRFYGIRDLDKPKGLTAEERTVHALSLLLEAFDAGE